jgi:hypothetical protein
VIVEEYEIAEDPLLALSVDACMRSRRVIHEYTMA